MTSQQPPTAGFNPPPNGYSPQPPFPGNPAGGPGGPGGPGAFPQHDFYQQPAPKQSTNVMAILSLVLGIGSLFSAGVLAIPAVILGHLSLKQIKTTGEQGRAMAIAGLVMGYLVLVLWVIALLAILLIFLITGTTLFFAGSTGGSGTAALLPMAMACIG